MAQNAIESKRKEVSPLAFVSMTGFSLFACPRCPHLSPHKNKRSREPLLLQTQFHLFLLLNHLVLTGDKRDSGVTILFNKLMGPADPLEPGTLGTALRLST
jgi:hypothetical protein